MARRSATLSTRGDATLDALLIELLQPKKISFHEGQAMRYGVSENIRVEHNDDADNRPECDGMPHDEAEDYAFVAHLFRGGCGYGNGLRVDHLAHDAAGAVRRAH